MRSYGNCKCGKNKEHLPDIKKPLVIVLMIAMLVVLAACSDSEEEIAVVDEGEEVVEVEEAEAEISASSEIDFGDLFDVVFVNLADQVSVMTYDEGIDYFNGLSFEYSCVPPDDEDSMCQIEAHDDSGARLSVLFYPSDDADAGSPYTICTVTYNYDAITAEVSDYIHMNSVSFAVYDDSGKTDVSSLDAIIEFMREDAPSLLEAYADAHSENSEIDVTLDVTYENDGNVTYFTVKTNLPDGTKLMLTLTDGDYTGQTHITVSNGSATSEGFSNKGNRLSGNYTLRITSGLPSTQSDDVIKIIGSNGEYLTGQYVTSDNGSNKVSAEFNLSF